MNKLKEKKIIIWEIFLMIMSFLILFSCSNFEKKTLDERFQKVLDKGLEKYDIRGVSAAIVFDTDSLWIGTSGISHDTVSMKPDMLFSIGSITKNFVAALTLKLVEEGTLSLEDKLSNWLPAYPNIDANITIRQLLNHTSGIYMFWDNDELWDALRKDRKRIWTPEEVLEYIKEPHFKAGESWGYSNTNYLLMAMIIEKAMQTSLASEIKERLLEPQKLQNYYMWLSDSIPENQAHVFGDNFQFGEPENDLTFLPRASHESITFGSSGIVTTALDLAKWCKALFEGNVISKESLDQMLDFIKFNEQHNMKGYGLGVQEFSEELSDKEKAIGHGGGNIGSATYMVYLPKYQTSIVVMVNAHPTNSVDFFTKGLIKEIARGGN